MGRGKSPLYRQQDYTGEKSITKKNRKKLTSHPRGNTALALSESQFSLSSKENSFENCQRNDDNP